MAAAAMTAGGDGSSVPRRVPGALVLLSITKLSHAASCVACARSLPQILTTAADL